MCPQYSRLKGKEGDKVFVMHGKPRRIWDRRGPPERVLFEWSEENDSPASRVGEAQGLLAVCKPTRAGPTS